MMKRYLLTYTAWLVGVLSMAAIAVAWYRYVENIGMQELADRLREPATGATEDTEVIPEGS